jgi:DNA-binding HxlR family transcriptional regulator
MEANQFSGILNKSWAINILSLYNPDEEGDQIIRWTDFKKRLHMNDKLLTERLKKLCEIGILRPERKGYSYSRKHRIYNIYKTDDIQFIQECSNDSIHTILLLFKKVKRTDQYASYLVFYGLEKYNRHIQDTVQDIMYPTVKKIRRYFNSLYHERFQSIVDEECKKIKDEHMVELIKKWHKKLAKDALLHPRRNNNDIGPTPIRFNAPKEQEIATVPMFLYLSDEQQGKLKEISDRIWTQFRRECPPIGIMLRV